MSGIGTGYDLSTTTYSPDGKVFQVDYAQKAIDNAGTAIGIRCKDGVVVACERLVQNKMIIPGSVRSVFPVAHHAGLACTGLGPDGRQLTGQAQAEAQRYHEFYGSDIPGKVLADRLGGFLHVYTLAWYMRPLGVAGLLGVYGDDGPELYLLEPSGTAHRYFGTVVGKGKQAARTELERLDLASLTCVEAVAAMCKIFYKLREEEKPYEIEMGWICDASDRKFKRVPAEVVAAAETKVKAELDSDSEMDD